MTRPKPNAKPQLFISHYGAEKDVALALQAALKQAFGEFVDVFLSSDENSLVYGATFAQTIKTAIKASKYGLFLLSPQALQRSWVNIEFGAFWVNDVLAVPIVWSAPRKSDESD